MSKSSEHKHLLRRKNELEKALSAIKESLSDLNNQHKQMSKSLNEINKKISYIEKDKDIIVSEHAYVRFFERVLGYNLEELFEEILSSDTREKVVKLSSCKIPININDAAFTFIFKNKVLVTIED
jgi:predicted  nucleic acid-binding Zn-ribbon protein